MNSENDPLDRLMRNAAQARSPELTALTPGLKQRLLQEWRWSRREDPGLVMVSMLQRAVALAFLVAAMVVGLSLQDTTPGSTETLGRSVAVIQYFSMR